MAKKKSAKSAAKKSVKKPAPRRPKKKSATAFHINTSIPAICDNPKCRTVWICPMLPEMTEHASVIFTDSHVRPCPNCGSRGTIPDGMYTRISDELFRRDQLQELINALSSVRGRIEAGASEHDVKRVINNDPRLEYFRNLLIPKSFADMSGLILLILTVMSMWSSKQSNVLSLPEELKECLVHTAQQLRERPPDSHSKERSIQEQSIECETGPSQNPSTACE